jgi:hypothetical protein
MTQVDMAPFVIPSCAFAATGTTSTGISTYTKMANGTVAYSPDGTFSSGKWTPNVAGFYRFSMATRQNTGSANTITISAPYKNGVAINPEVRAQGSTAGTIAAFTGHGVLMNGTDDYLEQYAYQNDSNPLDVQSAFAGERVSK